MRSQVPGSSMRCCTLSELLLERGGLACAAEHGLEIANGGRPAAVAKGSGAHQFEGGGAQAVVGHEDGRDVGGDQDAARTRCGFAASPRGE